MWLWCGKEKEYYLSGDWKFFINLENNNESIDTNVDDNEFVVSDSEYIKSSKVYLEETMFKIDIEFNEKLDDKFVVSDINNIILSNKNNNRFKLKFTKINENNLHLEFDFSKYDFGDELNLYIKFDENKEVNLIINKK